MMLRARPNSARPPPGEAAATATSPTAISSGDQQQQHAVDLPEPAADRASCSHAPSCG